VTTIRVLCVDDEPRVLEGLDNNLSLKWEVATATSAAAGLEELARHPYAVVISDMRMPGTDGAQFLKQAARRFPGVVRVLLTGQAELGDAARAINDAGIFRLLLKPCPTDKLVTAIAAAVRQHELLMSEQVLLHQTLRSSVAVLSEVLGLLHPVAFGCGNRVTSVIRKVLPALQLDDAWQIELAAMLSQLGCVTLDPALIDAAEAGQMTAEQQAAYIRHPQVGASLLAKIPRMNGVAAMVGAQFDAEAPSGTHAVMVGGELLQLAVRLDREQRRGVTLADALAKVVGERAWDRGILHALRAQQIDVQGQIAGLAARDLRPYMTLEADALSPTGDLWISKGVELTEVAIKQLRALAQRKLLAEPVRVRIPAAA
jgi:CheY-like chemotaxis protein